MRELWPLAVLILLGGTSPLTNDTLRVKRLEIVDGEGRVRGVLESDRFGPGLSLYDVKGIERFAAALWDEQGGHASLDLNDEDQRSVLVLGSSGGEGRVRVTGPRGAYSASISGGRVRSALDLSDATGHRASLEAVDDDGRVGLTLRDVRREPRVVLKSVGADPGAQTSFLKFERPQEPFGPGIIVSDTTASFRLSTVTQSLVEFVTNTVGADMVMSKGETQHGIQVRKGHAGPVKFGPAADLPTDPTPLRPPLRSQSRD